MNYGLPYKGSKNRIAKKILDILPAASVLYDVFCGGCAITHAALLSGKYKSVVANDINGMIPAAFEKAIRGGFRNEDRWISRDDFQKLYKTDPYVAICFSFGNNLHEYCYALNRRIAGKGIFTARRDDPRLRHGTRPGRRWLLSDH